MSARTHVVTEVHQAFAAFRLAQGARSDTTQQQAFEAARGAWEETLQLARENADQAQIRAAARETVRLAAHAESLVQDNALDRRAEARSIAGTN